MAADASPETGAPRQMRVQSFCGLTFVTLSDATPAIEEYIGPEVSARIRRVMKEPVRVLGGYSQIFPNNWKLYLDNVKDTYHASLLHSFFATFRLNRLSQQGGVVVGGDGGNHASFTMMRTDTGEQEYEKAKMRSARGGYRLEAPELLDTVDEIGDGVSLQILAVFPGFVLQQIMNCLAVRQVVPRGIGETELNWSCFGYASDDETMTERRLRQANLVGPAGFISLEDGAATGFVQRGVRGAADRAAIVEMGGRDIASSESRVSETSVRGFWQAYRRHMQI
jgi:anthranilate 1,2-dioxygenase large subunit/terephthalate 1,2-dioxygenase oxygenase component alpha subunit